MVREAKRELGGSSDARGQAGQRLRGKRVQRRGKYARSARKPVAAIAPRKSDGAIASGSGRRAPRAQAAFRLALAIGNGLRGREGKLGRRKDVSRLIGLRRELAIFANPACQEGFGGLFDPLLEQCGDFLAQIGSVVQTRKLEAFERMDGCLVQIVPWRSNTAATHAHTPCRESLGTHY